MEDIIMSSDVPNKTDIEQALRNTVYEGAFNGSTEFHDTSAAANHINTDLLNAARAIELERALTKMLLINFRDDKSIAHAYQNAREVMQKWGQL